MDSPNEFNDATIEMTPIRDSDDVPFTLDQRRRAALAEVDNASFSWFHVKVILVASIGFFTDAYDIFAINIVSTMLGYVYSHDHGNSLSANLDLGVKIATPVGTLVGQLLFGWMADIFGRKRMYGVELIIIIIGCFGQTLAGEAQAVNVIAVIIVWRFFMGIGIGGDYPLSAVISSEFSSRKFRGRIMTAVFSAQGWGTFTATVVALVVVAAFKNKVEHDGCDSSTTYPHIDIMWRLIFGLGCIPACFALYFRLTIPETPRFTMDIERNVKQASRDIHDFLTNGTFVVDPDAVVQRVKAPKASRHDFLEYFSKWENLKVLVGTSWSWFALDVAFYGLQLNNAIILTDMGWGNPTQSNSTYETLKNVTVCVGNNNATNLTDMGWGNSTQSNGTLAYETLRNVCVGNIILTAVGLIPGYYLSMLFIDSWGRKPIQLMGFAALTIIFIIMAAAYTKLAGMNSSKSQKGVFIFLFCLANFFSNFGPNTTTFVIPGEAFPTRYRSTAHGISAASGKLGVIISQTGFSQLKDRGGKGNFVNVILGIFVVFMVTGVFSTLLIPETKNRTLEDLSNESQEGFVEGVATHVETQEGLIVGNTALTP